RFAADVARYLPVGQAGKEEVRVVPPRLKLRRHPATPRREQVRAQHEIALGEQLRESEPAGDQRGSLRLPVVARHVAYGGGLSRAGEGPPRLLNPLAYGCAPGRLGGARRLAEADRPLGRSRSGPPDVGVCVAWIDGPAGEGVHAGGEGHRGGTTDRVH